MPYTIQFTKTGTKIKEKNKTVHAWHITNSHRHLQKPNTRSPATIITQSNNCVASTSTQQQLLMHIKGLDNHSNIEWPNPLCFPDNQDHEKNCTDSRTLSKSKFSSLNAWLFRWFHKPQTAAAQTEQKKKGLFQTQTRKTCWERWEWLLRGRATESPS